MITNDLLQKKLYDACKTENVKIIKHMLESKQIRKRIDLFADNCSWVKLICEKCNEELIDYISNLDEFKDLIKIKKFINNVFGNACYQNKLDILKFYFNNEKYKNHIDFNFSNGWFFRTAYSNSHRDILDFLIVEVGIKKDDNVIKTFISENSKSKEYVTNLFSKMELKNELYLNLQNEKKEISKIKI